MTYTFDEITEARQALRVQFDALDDKRAILRAPQLKGLYGKIKDLAAEDRKAFGAQVNALKTEVEGWLAEVVDEAEALPPIDVTAPFDVNVPTTQRPALLDARTGSIHPLSAEMDRIGDIFERMGFVVESSREIDDDFHMFESLNFPEGHPARDDWDTFMTEEGFIAPAHTSTMQNRILRKYAGNLAQGEPIAAVVPDRVFRNEDLDVTHEHTFYQIEGIYVAKGVTVGNLIATLKTYMSEYYGEELRVKIQPFYFPFTEPSFEFAVERPASMRKDSTEAEAWLEIGGCGMIHPNVLKYADIDPAVYTGFAFGFGVDRMVMLRNGIEDVRHFESGKLDFLRQFA